jgi:prolyl 4-hydroxylase
MSALDLRHALHLAEQGCADQALALIEPAAERGEADALYALGLWRLEGRHVARDLSEARRLVAAAEQAGSLAAARTLSAFLVTGIGAASDWPGGLALLERWSDRDPLACRQLELIGAMSLTEHGDPPGQAALEQVSGSPWIARSPGFLSAAEIAFLIDAAAQRFKPALVFNERERRFVPHPYRDATVASFPVVFEWPAIHAINRRIAAATGTSAAQGEPLQILRYGPGQQYREHLDAVPGLPNQRILTMLIALNDDFDGGATDFPKAGLSLRGQPGDALLFRNIGADERPDHASLHAGAPVTRGVKQIASRWIRAAPPPPGESFGQQEVLPPGAELGQ